MKLGVKIVNFKINIGSTVFHFSFKTSVSFRAGCSFWFQKRQFFDIFKKTRRGPVGGHQAPSVVLVKSEWVSEWVSGVIFGSIKCLELLSWIKNLYMYFSNLFQLKFGFSSKWSYFCPKYINQLALYQYEVQLVGLFSKRILHFTIYLVTRKSYVLIYYMTTKHRLPVARKTTALSSLPTLFLTKTDSKLTPLVI